jgi:hypothetical protein
MALFKIDDWVMYHQFPTADSEFLRAGKKSVILDILSDNKYLIYVDDPKIDEKWKVKEVREENLESIN